jgi:hypothetical protein
MNPKINPFVSLCARRPDDAALRGAPQGQGTGETRRAEEQQQQQPKRQQPKQQQVLLPVIVLPVIVIPVAVLLVEALPNVVLTVVVPSVVVPSVVVLPVVVSFGGDPYPTRFFKAKTAQLSSILKVKLLSGPLW